MANPQLLAQTTHYHAILTLVLGKPMPHVINMLRPRLLLQQNRPLRIPPKTPIPKSPGLLDPKPRMPSKRDPKNGAEFFEA
jgi:hypothetical protein